MKKFLRVTAQGQQIVCSYRRPLSDHIHQTKVIIEMLTNLLKLYLKIIDPFRFENKATYSIIE